jgi:hypothetical protein
VESCCELTDGSGHDDETGPVVLDKLSHFDLKISFLLLLVDDSVSYSDRLSKIRADG